MSGGGTKLEREGETECMFVEGSRRITPSHPQCYEYQDGLRGGNLG